MIKSFRHPLESVILAYMAIIMDDQELLKTLGPHDSDLPDKHAGHAGRKRQYKHVYKLEQVTAVPHTTFLS